jgi:predicted transcriptional regulator
MRLGVVLDGSLEECARLARRVAELEERLTAIRQTVFPHLREQTRRGELARDVEAEADPHPEPGAA